MFKELCRNVLFLSLFLKIRLGEFGSGERFFPVEVFVFEKISEYTFDSLLL